MQKAKKNTTDRRRKILKFVWEKRSVTIEQIHNELHTPIRTLKEDIKALLKLNLVVTKRGRYGGVCRATDRYAIEMLYFDRAEIDVINRLADNATAEDYKILQKLLNDLSPKVKNPNYKSLRIGCKYHGISSLERQIKMIQIINIRRFVKTKELMEIFGISKETVRKDFYALMCEHAIDALRGSHGGIILQDGYYLNIRYLKTDEEECIRSLMPKASESDRKILESILYIFVKHKSDTHSKD